MEAPQRNFATTIFNWRVKNMFKNIADAIEGKLAMGFGEGTALRGFVDEAELRSNLKSCEAAEQLASELHDDHFAYEARLVHRWLSILNDCYSLDQQRRKAKRDTKTIARLYTRIGQDLAILPTLWEQWIQTVESGPHGTGPYLESWRTTLQNELNTFQARLTALRASEKPVPHAENLLQDPSFKRTDKKPAWKFWNESLITFEKTSVQAEEFTLKMIKKVPADDPMATQVIPVSPGKTYRVSCWVKSDASHYAGFVVYGIKPDNTLIPKPLIQGNTKSNARVRIKRKILIPDGVKGIWLKLLISRGAPSGECYFDHCEIVEVSGSE